MGLFWAPLSAALHQPWGIRQPAQKRRSTGRFIPALPRGCKYCYFIAYGDRLEASYRLNDKIFREIREKTGREDQIGTSIGKQGSE